MSFCHAADSRGLLSLTQERVEGQEARTSSHPGPTSSSFCLSLGTWSLLCSRPVPVTLCPGTPFPAEGGYCVCPVHRLQEGESLFLRALPAELHGRCSEDGLSSRHYIPTCR